MYRVTTDTCILQGYKICFQYHTTNILKIHLKHGTSGWFDIRVHIRLCPVWLVTNDNVQMTNAFHNGACFLHQTILLYSLHNVKLTGTVPTIERLIFYVFLWFYGQTIQCSYKDPLLWWLPNFHYKLLLFMVQYVAPKLHQ